MTVRLSSGLKDAMLGETGLKGALADGVIRIYSGAQPASADNAIAGTLLAEITEGGGAFAHGSPTNGLEFDPPSLGIIAKAVAETWTGNGLANGTAGSGRICANPLDDGTSSTTLARLDFSVGKSTGDLQLSTVNVETGVPVTVDVAQITLP